MKFEYLIKTLETCLLYVSDDKKKEIIKQIKKLKR
jgi:hypothetical protein